MKYNTGDIIVYAGIPEHDNVSMYEVLSTEEIEDDYKAYKLRCCRYDSVFTVYRSWVDSTSRLATPMEVVLYRKGCL